MLRVTLTFFLLIWLGSECFSQRLVQNINAGWEFKLDKEGAEKKLVNLPHTWNAEDAFLDGVKYFRGKGVYEKALFIPEEWNQKKIFIRFEGANQESQVWVNDQFAGRHVGGYTAFVFDITELLNPGKENTIRVDVDNAFNQNVPPLEADFNFYGGIYRDVELLVVNPVHFKIAGESAGNLQIKIDKVSHTSANLTFRGEIKGNEKSNVKLEVKIISPNGDTIKTITRKIKRRQGDFALDLKINHPKLWSPDSPDLYELEAFLTNAANGEILDDFYSDFGCRWFTADPVKGFYLNGKPLKLIGVNRHQDFEGLGNALDNSLHRRDYKTIKEMGSNFIRTAHYPQDPEVYKLCDRLGLIVWTEIPIINDVTNTKAYFHNAVNMQREQILQLYNHPSIIFWGYMNEIFIRMVFSGNMSEKDREAKIRTSVELAEKLEKVTKELDPQRLSVMALHENEVYNTSGIADIPDVIGWNLYFGWYTQGLENLGKFLDKQHQQYPKRPILLSEYGPGSDTRLHAAEPKPWDYTEDYQLESHISYVNQVQERDYVLGMAAWNFADFGSSGRQDSRPFINQKGLVNFNRETKDIYHYYQSILLEDDFVYIAGKHESTKYPKFAEPVRVKVFSNQERVNLRVNDSINFTSNTFDHVAAFELELPEGNYSLKATAGKATSFRSIKVVPRNTLLKKIGSEPLQINVGTHVNFTDEKTGETWISDQAYSQGSYGYIGGTVFQQSPTKFQGIASNIKLTGNDPLYQTMREGIAAYKFDVPGGRYRVTLLFTEPNSRASDNSIYNLNLSGEELGSDNGVRSFDIVINGRPVRRNLNLAAQYGVLQATDLAFEIRTTKGIKVDFVSNSGKPVLSGIKLERL